ncbi:MAG: FkbM family methyltransferase [Salinibacter sp.]
MSTALQKVSNFFVFHYYSLTEWTFPPGMPHTTACKMISGTYEPEVSNAVKSALSGGSVFIDIGANVGYFSKLAAPFVGAEGTIYGVEADHQNFSALAENTTEYQNVVPIHLALSDGCSILELHRSSHSACHSLADTGNYMTEDISRVPAITLDFLWKNYLDSQPIDLLKIDVEGAEMNVLNGGNELFGSGMIDTMIVEYCPEIMKHADIDINSFYHKIASHFEVKVLEEKHRVVDGRGDICTQSDFHMLTEHLLEFGAAENVNLLCNLSS